MTPAQGLGGVRCNGAGFLLSNFLGFVDSIPTSRDARWLKRSAFLFLVGFWIALLAATEHLWTWSKYIAMPVE